MGYEKRLALSAMVLAAAVLVSRMAFAQEVGTVADLAGTAKIGRAGVWTDATVGTAIQQNDQLRTGQPGRMRVVFQDDSVLTLTDESHVVVDQQVFDPEKGKARSIMGLLKGKVSALVSEYYHHSGSLYEIKTSTAVAGVRGTDFVMKYDPRDGVTEVVGISGHVEVRSALDPTAPGVLVTASEMTTVARGQGPKPPKRLSDSLFRQNLEGIEFIGAGRLQSQTVDHPLLTGATVPPADRAATVTAGTVPGTAGAGEVIREPRDASTLLHQPPAALNTTAGRLKIGLF